MKQTWFVSHPSGSWQHTPVFFQAVEAFAKTNPEVNVVYARAEAEEYRLTKDAISTADLMLAEISIPSTGSGIELGWANAAGIPVIGFHQGGSEPSPAIKFVTRDINVYITEPHIAEVLQKLVAEISNES